MELKRNTKLKGGDYTIDKILGQGGFGITYLAKMRTVVEGKLGRMETLADVVVKEYFLDKMCDRAADGKTVMVRNQEKDGHEYNHYREKFKREAYNLAKMKTPNIVDVVDIIEDENQTSYYVMKYLSGGNLADKAADGLPEDRAERYFRQILSAVDYMHQHKMCHYDLKPNNVMLDSQDNAVLIDFGFAEVYSRNGREVRSTLTNHSIGYSPLEQGSVKTFSPTIDVYSLGASLFYLLTGNSPQRASFNIRDVIGEQPGNISVRLWSVITKCMQSHPNNRLQSVNEIFDALDCKSKKPGKTEVISNHEPPRPKPKMLRSSWLKRNLKWLFLLMVVTVLTIVVVLNSRPDNIDETKSNEEDPSLVPEKQQENVEEETRLHKVEDFFYESGIGVCSYTGMVDGIGLPQGWGRIVFEQGDVYEGTFVNGVMNGDSCKYTFQNGDFFEGAFKDDHFDKGRLVLTSKGFTFNGTFTSKNQPDKGDWEEIKK